MPLKVERNSGMQTGSMGGAVGSLGRDVKWRFKTMGKGYAIDQKQTRGYVRTVPTEAIN